MSSKNPKYEWSKRELDLLSDDFRVDGKPKAIETIYRQEKKLRQLQEARELMREKGSTHESEIPLHRFLK